MPPSSDTPPAAAGTPRRAAVLGGAALAALAVAGAVWLVTGPALTLVEGRAAREHAVTVAVLRLADAGERLAAATPPLAEARIGAARLAARGDLRGLARDLAGLLADIAQSELPRTVVDSLRRPLSDVDGEIEEIDRVVEARIAADAALSDALLLVPRRHAAVRATVAPLADEALRGGGQGGGQTAAPAAALLAVRDDVLERAHRLSDRLLTGSADVDGFQADARALDALLARLPIGPSSVGRADAARQLMALGLDPGNVFELRQELARLGATVGELTRAVRLKAGEVSQTARRVAAGLGDAAATERANATALLRAAPVLAATLAGLAVLAAGAWRRGAAPPAAPPAAVPVRDEPAGLRILLAEDERMTQMVAATILRRAGHTVTVVGDGRAALEAVRDRPFDLVVLDLRMPDMDGVAALRAIRALPDRDRAAVRAVILSASALPEDGERCRAAGADAVLAKPLRLDALLAAVEHRSAVSGAAADKTAADKTATDRAATPVFDSAALDPMLDALPPSRVAALIGSTLAALADYRGTLRSAWDGGDRAAVGSMAHKVAGVAGVYGCLALREAARALERAVETNDGDAAALMAAVEAAYDPALAALERERTLLPATAGPPAG